MCTCVLEERSHNRVLCFVKRDTRDAGHGDGEFCVGRDDGVVLEVFLHGEMGELDCAGSLIDGDEAGAYVEERFGLGQV